MVDGLKLSQDESSLQEAFEKFGTLASVSRKAIYLQDDTVKSVLFGSFFDIFFYYFLQDVKAKIIGYVTFENKEAAQKAFLSPDIIDSLGSEIKLRLIY